jgi:Leucine-rich repeat (LRR) protein
VLDGETTLIACGNALEVFSDAEFYPKVTSMFLKFIRFDFIIKSPTLSLLRNFTNMRSITLECNNISSFIHLSKLESMQHLRSLTIEGNDISHSVLYRSYVVYRFPHITAINGEDV